MPHTYLFLLIFIFLTAVKIAFANDNEQQNQVTEERSSKSVRTRGKLLLESWGTTFLPD